MHSLVLKERVKGPFTGIIVVSYTNFHKRKKKIKTIIHQRSDSWASLTNLEANLFRRKIAVSIQLPKDQPMVDSVRVFTLPLVRRGNLRGKFSPYRFLKLESEIIRQEAGIGRNAAFFLLHVQ